MFKSKKELAIALMEGRKFSVLESTLYFDEGEGGESPFKIKNKYGGINSMAGIWSYYDGVEEIKELAWYENIPKQGVLCWCSYDEERVVSIVLQYYPENRYKFRDINNTLWETVTPLTKVEVDNLIYKGEG